MAANPVMAKAVVVESVVFVIMAAATTASVVVVSFGVFCIVVLVVDSLALVAVAVGLEAVVV